MNADEYQLRLGEVLVQIRKARGRSAAWLAEHVDRSEAAVSRWETGKVTPSGYDLRRVAEVLNAPADLLLFPPEREMSHVARRLVAHDAAGKDGTRTASG